MCCRRLADGAGGAQPLPAGWFSLTPLAAAAADLIADNWPAVCAVAQALLVHERLDYRGVLNIINKKSRRSRRLRF